MTDRLPSTLKTKLGRAKRALTMTAALRAFWPVWVALCGVVALVALGLFDAVSPGIAAVLAVGSAVLLGGFAWRGWRSFALPTDRDALRALDGSLSERAASMLDDDVAVGAEDDGARALWAAHRERLLREAARAEAPETDTRLSKFDPNGLRFAAPIAAAVALVYAQSGGREAVAALLQPVAPARAAVLEPALEAWASPPPYTGVAPIYLSERTGDSIELPVGSTLTMRATAVNASPVVEGIDAAFSQDLPGVYGLTHVLTDAARLEVLNGVSSLGVWTISVIPDEAPVIEVVDPPESTDRQGLGFAFAALDDYGVLSATGTIVADRSNMADPPEELDEPVQLDLGAQIGLEANGEAERFEVDLTEHPLAGSPVEMVLSATDGAEQRARSETVSFVLPERVFTEPMAKALVEQRRVLAWDIRTAWDVLDRLEAVTEYPDDYFNDAGAYLMVSSAISRLYLSLDSGAEVDRRDEVLELLWQAALKLEEGDLENALEQLRAAQRRLQDAIERGASDEELERLMNDMRQAMNNYLDQMARQAMREGQTGDPEQQMSQNGQSLSREDLERMLDQLGDAAKNGAREQAEQMLAMLGEMLENMQMQQAQNGQGGQQGEQQLQELQEMMRRQQELADDTYRELQQGQRRGNGQQGEGQQGQPQPGQRGQQGQGQQGEGQMGQGPQQGQGQGGQGSEPGAQGGRALADRQGALRDDLAGMAENLQRGGQAGGDALGEAERQMGNAQGDLEGQSFGEALTDQSRALDALRDGAQQLAQELAQQSQPGTQSGDGDPNMAGQAQQFDPFGRLARGMGPDDGEGVDVPDQRSRSRALEIQREIRRRSSERERGETELDYLERLQKRF